MSIAFLLLILSIVYVGVGGRTKAMVHLWRSRTALWSQVLLFHLYTHFRAHTQITKFVEQVALATVFHMSATKCPSKNVTFLPVHSISMDFAFFVLHWMAWGRGNFHFLSNT